MNIQTPDGWEPVYGPVQSVPLVTLIDDKRCLLEGCVTVGNRVRAFWQDFGHLLGNGTIVGFERATGRVEEGFVAYPEGWIKAVIDYDYPTDLSMGEDGFVRWDYDRLVLCPGHCDGETQEESVGRLRRYLAEQREKSAAS